MPWIVRSMQTGDAPAIQHLLESSPAYTRRVSGRGVAPGDGAALLEALPPGVEPAAKTVFGLLAREGTLLGVCDVIAHWPEPGTAHIGLLLVRESHAGRGLGRRLHDEVLARVRADGALVRLRAGIVATNAAVAEPFWRRLGYRPTGETKPYRDGEVDSTVAIWTRSIPPPDAPAGMS